jgi:hypothetical protein
MVTEGIPKVRCYPIVCPVLFALVLENVIIDNKVFARMDSKEVIPPWPTDRDRSQNLFDVDCVQIGSCPQRFKVERVSGCHFVSHELTFLLDEFPLPLGALTGRDISFKSSQAMS